MQYDVSHKKRKLQFYMNANRRAKRSAKKGVNSFLFTKPRLKLSNQSYKNLARTNQSTQNRYLFLCGITKPESKYSSISD